MTLMPVSNTWALGSSVSKSGPAVDLPALVDLDRARRRRGLADHVEHVAEHASPTGTGDAVAGVAHRVPRVRPSVGFMQMARTRLSPICWATSAAPR
jgi:hypothetical protein